MKKLNFTAPIACLLLCFVANVHAADAYDTPNKTLTIPLVTVGNTTYSNVTLKLNDFQVLRVDPNPLTGVVENGMLTQFVSAIKSGSELKVTFQLTSQVDSISNVGFVQEDTKLIDNKGNVYYAKTKQVANKTTGDGFPFIANVPVVATLTYNVLSDATSISLMNLFIGGGNISTKYQLRNIPI